MRPTFQNIRPAPVGTPHVLVVHPSLGVTTFAEFVGKARENKGLDYSSTSQGSPGNLVGELLAKSTGITLSHIAYRGAGQAINDLVAGHLPAGIISLSTANPFIEHAMLVPLAVSTAKRIAALPSVPTLKELGMPDLVTVSWYGLSGPAGLPADITVRLNQEVNRAVDSPLCVPKTLSELMP